MLFRKLLISASTTPPVTQGNLFGFGANGNSQLGNGSTTTVTTVTQIGSTTSWAKIYAANGTRDSGTTTGAFSAAIRADNTLWMWGCNDDGQLGQGNTTSQSTPVQVSGSWKQVALVNAGSGYSYTLGIKTDGTMWGWGNNAYYQLGMGNTTNHTSPTQIGTDTDWAMVSGTMFKSTSITTCANAAIKTSGKLYTWGQNAGGATGQGTTSGDTTSPTQVGSGTDWSFVACGTDGNNPSATGNYMMAVKTTGTLWGWGKNANYQLGQNNTTDQSSPTQTGTGTSWVSVYTGTYGVSHGLQSDNTLWSWGNNFYGMTGLNLASGTTHVPTKVNTSTWSYISMPAGTYAVGAGHTIGIKTDGTMWAWGANLTYNLGNGSSAPDHLDVPTQIGSGTTWFAAATGGGYATAGDYLFSLALKT